MNSIQYFIYVFLELLFLEFSDTLTGSKSSSDSRLMKLTSNVMHISSLQRFFRIAAPNLREVGENWEYVSKLLQGNVIGKKKSY